MSVTTESKVGILRCDQCRFFHAHPPATEPNTIIISADGVRGGGECRRQPPLAHMPDKLGFPTLAYFPLVACDNWCGAFESQ